MQALLGRKLHMTQVFREDGTVIPVTLVEAGPCTVAAVRTAQNGATRAVLGFGSKKSVNKPQRAQWGDLGSFAFVREIDILGDATVERGAVVDASLFAEGDTVSVVGTSKGKGFQGVVKRWGFAGSPASHGHKDQLRMPGSIGSGGPQRVFKGTKMGGRMGGDRVTVKNLEIVQVDAEKGIVAIKGAVPGSRGSYLTIRKSDGDVWHK